MCQYLRVFQSLLQNSLLWQERTPPEPHHSPAGISPSLRGLWGALTHPSKPEHSTDFPHSVITIANKINKQISDPAICF